MKKQFIFKGINKKYHVIKLKCKLKMRDVRGRGCQSVNKVVLNNFFVNCYSLFASIKQVGISEIF